MKTLVYWLAGVWLLVGAIGAGWAGPSSTFWTPCTIDIQPASTIIIGINDFFSFDVDTPERSVPNDLGFQFGAQINNNLAMEYGLDILSTPSIVPLFFNVKIGYRENVIFKNAPALQLGIWNYSTKKDHTNNRQDIIYITTGKTLSDGKTRVMASYYAGNADALVSSSGSIQDAGFMVAVDYHTKNGKWVFAGDYASGNNAIGGGGFGAYYNFTNNINMLFGPVWFNDKGLNGSTKLLLQVNFEM